MPARIAVVIAIVLALPRGAAAQPATERVSVSSRGVQGNSYSLQPVLSPDGRYVAFMSDASNLIRHDRNRRVDIFRRDRERRVTTRVARRADRATTQNPFLLDGPFLGFIQFGEARRYLLRNLRTGGDIQLNLSARDKPVDVQFDDPVAASTLGRHFAFAAQDGGVFVRDREAGTTTRVSVRTTGKPARGRWPAISADGRIVAFQSDGPHLVPDDVNGVSDVFVRDRAASTTVRLTAGNGLSQRPSVSGDGRLVAFDSDASNLVPGDTNAQTDVFVYDRGDATIRRVSVSSTGEQANGASFGAVFIGPRLIRFATTSNNLVPGDANDHFEHLVRDLRTDRTTWAAPRPPTASEGESSYPISFSADGRWIAFDSSSPDQVRGDTNRRQDVFVHGPLPVPFELPAG